MTLLVPTNFFAPSLMSLGKATGYSCVNHMISVASSYALMLTVSLFPSWFFREQVETREVLGLDMDQTFTSFAASTKLPQFG